MCVYVCGVSYPDLLRGWCHVQPDSGVNGKTEKMNTAMDK